MSENEDKFMPHEEIWIQYYDEEGNVVHPGYATWAQNKIQENDIKYVLAETFTVRAGGRQSVNFKDDIYNSDEGIKLTPKEIEALLNDETEAHK